MAPAVGGSAHYYHELVLASEDDPWRCCHCGHIGLEMCRCMAPGCKYVRCAFECDGGERD
jgi:hypothetical protein